MVICIGQGIYHLYSLTALQVQFDPQNYTVTAGGVASITLVTSTSRFEFDFNVTLQYVDGTATGEPCS